MFKDDVSPIDVPEALEAFKESPVVRPLFISTARVPQNTNSGSPAGLRTPKAWQCRYRTADDGKEITPSHELCPRQARQFRRVTIGSFSRERNATAPTGKSW